LIPLVSHYNFNRAFTLIELLVVVALIGILSAVGIVSYSGYTKSAKQKNAELSLNTINLGLQEYKSSFGSYYTGASTCSAGSSALIVTNVLDGQDNLTDQDFQFCISASGSNYTITAKNPNTGCEISLNQTLKATRNNSC
tara:strand:+ start:10335 stop:10754 length:420 start_codon:yes stop_codon:yes gene_type:complete